MNDETKALKKISFKDKIINFIRNIINSKKQIQQEPVATCKEKFTSPFFADRISYKNEIDLINKFENTSFSIFDLSEEEISKLNDIYLNKIKILQKNRL